MENANSRVEVSPHVHTHQTIASASPISFSLPNPRSVKMGRTFSRNRPAGHEIQACQSALRRLYPGSLPIRLLAWITQPLFVQSVRLKIVLSLFLVRPTQARPPLHRSFRQRIQLESHSLLSRERLRSNCEDVMSDLVKVFGNHLPEKHLGVLHPPGI
jgi:hypothetical protein